MARALRAWAINRWKKNSVRNLQYGPKTRLIRGITGVRRYGIYTNQCELGNPKCLPSAESSCINAITPLSCRRLDGDGVQRTLLKFSTIASQQGWFCEGKLLAKTVRLTFDLTEFSLTDMLSSPLPVV